MKADTHPDYHMITVQMTDGTSLDLDIGRQLRRSLGHIIYKTLSLVRHHTERPV